MLYHDFSNFSNLLACWKCEEKIEIKKHIWPEVLELLWTIYLQKSYIYIQKANVIKKHVNHLEQKMQPYIFSYFHCSYLVLRALANKHTFILQGGPLKIDEFFLNF